MVRMPLAAILWIWHGSSASVVGEMSALGQQGKRVGHVGVGGGGAESRSHRENSRGYSDDAVDSSAAGMTRDEMLVCAAATKISVG